MSLHQRLLPYVVAVGSTAIALWVSMAFQVLLPQTEEAFFFIAIAITAWYGGFKPGGVAIAVSIVMLDYYFLPPLNQVGAVQLNDGLWLILFVVVSLIITLLSSNLRASRKKLEQFSRQLANESAERLQVALNLVQVQLEQQSLIMEMTQRIRQSLNLHEILQTTVDEVRQVLQVDRVVIFEFSEQWGGAVTVESVATNVLSILPFNIYDPCIGDRYVEPFRRGLVTAKSDIYQADISPCHVEFLAQFQVRANLVVPILQGEQLWGLLVAHHCTAPRHWQESEIDLLRQLASQLSIALQQSALLKQVQTELNERKQAEQALRESERRLSTLISNLPGYVYRVANDPDYTPEFISEGVVALTEYSQDEYLRDRTITCGQEIHPDDAEAVWQQVQQAVAAHQPYETVYRIFTRSGVQKWVWERGQGVYAETGELLRLEGFVTDITDRKQAEIALKQAKDELEQRIAERTAELTQLNERLLASDEKFRQLAENIEAVFWIRDVKQQQVVYVSPAYETIWQRRCDSLYQNFSDWIDAIHPVDRKRVETAAIQLITVGYYDQEYRICRPDGSVRWIRDRAFSIRNEAGDIVRVAGLADDITTAKQLEAVRLQTDASLRQQTRQNQLLWNITQSIRQSLDLDSILKAAVTQVRQILDTDRVAIYRFHPNWSGDFIAESVADGWVKLVHPNVQAIWPDTYLQETQGGRFRNHETLTVSDIYTADLQPCHIELLEQFQARAYAIAPITVGESLWGLFALYKNDGPHAWDAWEIELLQQTTSQLAIAIQQAELYSQLQTKLQERKQASAVLREAERRWRFLLDNVQLIVVGLDQSGTVSYVNPFFLNLTGYTAAEALGQNWFEHFLPSSTQVTMQSVFTELMAHNTYPHYQNAILTKSGEERMVAWNNTLLQDSNGTHIGTISIGEDITERQKVEEMKQEFISIVSHELRTPLTAIQMSLGLLQMGIYAKKPEKSQRMIEIALTDTNRLVNLVNDILDLERLESGRAVLEKTICHADDLMQQAVNGMQAIAAQQQITLLIAPTHAIVWAAADTIIQTLTNLLSNAIKFSPADSVILLSAEAQADMVLFQVSDRGRGIPADKLETIFGRFQQVDASDSREKGGTGLGLPICRSIIERHGGQIWVESTLGEGSTFFFTLPIPAESNV